MMLLIPNSLVDRKEQLTYSINLIFIVTGVIFIIYDYFFDYLVDGYWSAGSVRQVELIFSGLLVIALLRMKFLRTAKLITSLSLILIFCVSPIFITLNYLEMYYINTLLLPVIVLIPSLVYYAQKDRRLILSLFIVSILTNFACEQLIFRFKSVSPADLEFYNYHFGLFSLAKIFTSLFIYVNIRRLFRQNELFEMKITNANEELNKSNHLVNSQKQMIEEQNNALLKSEAELKKLDIAKSHFFANISHEFRTPLTLLLGPLGDHIRKAVDPAEKEQFIVMKRSATRLLNLVNQLLDLSRLESGMLKLQASYSDLGAFVKRLTSQFMSIAESRQIEFRINIPQGVFLWFDADKVEKIVTNILANAFKFTPGGGVVSLVVRQVLKSVDGKEGSVEIEVSDSGIGIDEDKVDRIFERFYRVSDSSRSEYEGTGIGLALAQELAEVHYGTIRAFSRHGQGSIFTVSLPLGNTHLDPNEIVEKPEEHKTVESDFAALTDAKVRSVPVMSQPDERPLVLVIEDNIDLQKYLGESLRHDYRVSFAGNGQEGFDVALTEPPDLIISDLMMPKVDGIELVRQIKSDERTSHIPVILLTARADPGTKLAGIETGADDFLAKPFEMIEIKARIQNLIEGRKRLREKFMAALVIRPNEMKVKSLEDHFLQKVLTSIDSHIADDLFGVSELAEDAAMSTIQLYRKLKVLTGKTPNDLIKNMRLDRARSLLEQHAGNVSEVAVQVGFRNMSYFAKCFKEKFGVNPSEKISDH